ncbi:AEC family transporter [Amycolatopsis sp. YIM 10]|uniref:AEC family transporter n=1 Tax=Amycolatopsis sp. YIM 10 TaxID=2653857 RepID=UPI0012901618|nr:AEC family transporter [Amycolatopsis sp. YIM 10]QFU90647.1 Membrane transport protein [Amycolatopsis sp. YIM 10]
MGGALTAFAPIWALTGLGYLLSRFGVLGDRADAVLTRLAFQVAMPAVLFSTLIGTPFSALADRGLLAFVLGTVLVALVAFTLSTWVFRRRRAERTLSAAAASYVNAGNLGIPVALQVLGSSSFIVAVLLFQSLLMMPSMLAAIESDVPRDDGPRWRRLVLLPVRNPVIAASMLGLLVGGIGIPLPAVVLEPIHTLGDAGVACALLVLGMSLHGDQVAAGPVGERRRAEAVVVVVLKALVQPGVTLGAGLLLGLSGPSLFAAVLCSALPTAQNVFIASSQYAVDVRFVRNCVLVSTLLSMGSLTLIAWLLGGAVA